MARTPNIDPREDYQRNYIINGNLDFWQRGTSANTVQAYLADRFQYFGGTWTIDYTRESDVPASALGAQYSLKVQRQFAASVAAGDQASIDYKVEGYDAASLLDKRVTLSFWVKSDAAGTYGLSFTNEALNRSYVTTYSIAQAGVWEKKTVSLEIDPSGTWNITNGVGLRIRWSFGDGSDFETATVDQWQAGNFKTTAGARKPVETIGGFLQLAQIQLVEGSEDLPFRRAGRTVAEELMLCQRYYEKSYDTGTTPGGGAVTPHSAPRVDGPTVYQSLVEYSVKKRIAAPTITTYDTSGNVNRVSGRIAGTTQANVTYTLSVNRENHFSATTVAGVLGGGFPNINGDTIVLYYEWTADAEL